MISDTTDTVAVGAEATAKAAEQEDDGIEHYIECWDDTYHTPCMNAYSLLFVQLALLTSRLVNTKQHRLRALEDQ